MIWVKTLIFGNTHLFFTSLFSTGRRCHVSFNLKNSLRARLYCSAYLAGDQNSQDDLHLEVNLTWNTKKMRTGTYQRSFKQLDLCLQKKCVYMYTHERTAIKMKIGQGLVNYIMLLASKMTMMIRIFINERFYFRQKSQQRAAFFNSSNISLQQKGSHSPPNLKKKEPKPSVDHRPPKIPTPAPRTPRLTHPNIAVLESDPRWKATKSPTAQPPNWT